MADEARAEIVSIDGQVHWPVVIKLRTPVDWGKEGSIDELVLRRGRAGDMKGLKVGGAVPFEDLILLASRLSGRPVGFIEKIDQDDFGEVAEAVMLFYAKSLKTLPTPSGT